MAIAFVTNPIIAREVRARWRGRAFTYVFAYSLLLAVAMGGFYYFIIPDSKLANTDDVQVLQEAGRNLFIAVTCLQMMATILIAPALTATVIVSEREQGMLEAVQLTPLAPWRIVTGKLLSVVLFLGIMLLVPLPIIAISFMLGGVSPVDFCIVALLQATTATTCAIIGLTCSARSRRSGTALFTAFFFTLLWLISSYVPLGLASSMGSGMMLSTTGVWQLSILNLFAQANPTIAALALFAPEVERQLSSTPPYLAVPPWIISISFQTVLSLFLLWLATRAVRRPFREQYWSEPETKGRKSVFGSTPVPNSHGAEISGQPDQRSAQAGQDQWRQLPLASLLRFSNPVLDREIQARFRVRHISRWLTAVLACCSLVVLYYYLLWAWEIATSPASRWEFWWWLVTMTLLPVMLTSAILGAMAFSREREAGTWEALRLSLLTPQEIIWGKMSASLLVCLIYSLPLWPLLLMCVSTVTYQGEIVFNGGYSNIGGYSVFYVSLTQAVATLLILTSAAWCCTACGMIFSWFCRRTPTAVGWTLGTLGFLSVVALLAPTAWDPRVPMAVSREVMRLWHPVAALGVLAARAGRASVTFDGVSSALIIFVLGWILLAILRRDIERRIDREDVK